MHNRSGIEHFTLKICTNQDSSQKQTPQPHLKRSALLLPLLNLLQLFLHIKLVLFMHPISPKMKRLRPSQGCLGSSCRCSLGTWFGNWARFERCGSGRLRAGGTLTLSEGRGRGGGSSRISAAFLLWATTYYISATILEYSTFLPDNS